MPKKNKHKAFTYQLICKFVERNPKKGKKTSSLYSQIYSSIITHSFSFASIAMRLLKNYSESGRLQKELEYLSFLRKSYYWGGHTYCFLLEALYNASVEGTEAKNKQWGKLVQLSDLLKVLSGKVLLSICLEGHVIREYGMTSDKLKNLDKFFCQAIQFKKQNQKEAFDKLMNGMTNVSNNTLNFQIAAYQSFCDRAKIKKKVFSLQNAYTPFGPPIPLENLNLLTNLFWSNSLVQDFGQANILPKLDTETLWRICAVGDVNISFKQLNKVLKKPVEKNGCSIRNLQKLAQQELEERGVVDRQLIWGGEHPLCLLEDGTLYRLYVYNTNYEFARYGRRRYAEIPPTSSKVIAKNVSFAVYGGENDNYRGFCIVAKADRTVWCVYEDENNSPKEIKINLPTHNKSVIKIDVRFNGDMICLLGDNTVLYGSFLNNNFKSFKPKCGVKQIVCAFYNFLILLKNGEVLTSTKTSKFENNKILISNAERITVVDDKIFIMYKDKSSKKNFFKTFSPTGKGPKSTPDALSMSYEKVQKHIKHHEITLNKMFGKINQLIERDGKLLLLSDDVYAPYWDTDEGKHWFDSKTFLRRIPEGTKQVDIVLSMSYLKPKLRCLCPVFSLKDGRVQIQLSSTKGTDLLPAETKAKQIMATDDDKLFFLLENDQICCMKDFSSRNRRLVHLSLPLKERFTLKHAAIRFGSFSDKKVLLDLFSGLFE